MERSRFAMAIVLVGACTAGPAFGFAVSAVDGSGPSVSDLVADPNHYFAFGRGGQAQPIRYKFTPEFVARFSDPRVREQVHMAFDEWSEATPDAQRRADEARYGYTRHVLGSTPFIDIRSLVQHELGHALGSQHPDASWFNGNPQYMRNFTYDAGNNLVAAPPIGGEIMNEGQGVNNQGMGLPDAKPPRGLGWGEYWRKLSKDELAYLDYVYGQKLYFQFVGPDDEAEIVLDVFASTNCGPSLGVAGPDTWTLNDPDDKRQGAVINTSTLDIRFSCDATVDDQPIDVPVGFVATPKYWEITNNTGENLISLLVGTDGTDNEVPTGEQSVGPKRFTDYTNFPSTDANTSLEANLHQWSKPFGGPIADGQSTQVKLQLDVWDWWVTSSQALTEDLAGVWVPLVNVDPFWVPGITKGGVLEPADDPHAGHNHDLIVGDQPAIALKAIEITNDGPGVMTLQQIAVALVGDLLLELDDLGTDLTDRLNREGRLEHLLNGTAADDVVLQPGQAFYIVAEGDVALLPTEAIAAGRYLVFDRPEWFDEELLVYTMTDNGDFAVGGQVIMNSRAIVPEPTTVAGLSAGVAACLRRRR